MKHAFGQLSNQKVQLRDSLLNEISKSPSDSSMANLYNGLASVYYRYNFDSCHLYLDTAINYAEKSGHVREYAWSLRIRGSVLNLTSSEDDPYEYFLKSLALSESADEDRESARTCNTLGIYYKRKSVYDSAMYYYKKGYALADKIGDLVLTARFLGNMANIEKRLGNYDDAVVGYKAAIKLADSIGAESSKGTNLMNLANIYTLNGNKVDAIDAFLEAKKIAEKTSDYQLLAYVLNNLGSVYVGMDDFDQAHTTLIGSLEASEKIDLKRMISANYRDLGNLSYQQGKNEEALNYFEKCLEVAKVTNEASRIADASAFLAKCYLALNELDKSLSFYNESLDIYTRLGEKESIPSIQVGIATALVHKKQFNEALKLAKRGTDGAIELGKIGLISDGYQQQFHAQNALGRYKDALQSHINFKIFDDSLLNVDLVKQVTTLENDYRFEQEREQQQREQDANEAVLNAQILAQKNLRNVFILGVGILIVVAFFLLMGYRNKRKANVILNAKNEEISSLSQFKEAMTGMIAHDLKNPLGIILGTETEKPATRQMARQMLNLVNNMLDVHKFENTEVILDTSERSLVGIVNVAVEQVRPLLSEKNIHPNISIESKISVIADYDYLLRVFVNLFTNAIKYSPNNASIEVISKEAQNGNLDISVSDHGSGIASENIHMIFESFEQVDPKKSGGVGSTGLGLAFCQLALRAHGSEISVESKVGQGTTFKFQLKVANEQSIIQNDTGNHVFTMSEKERSMIISKIPELRNMKLHQAFEIEEFLDELKKSNQNLDQWAQEVVNAAYSNNQIHYNELLDLVEKSN